MPTNDYIELPQPAFPRAMLDGILLSARMVVDAMPEYYLVPTVSTVGYLYLVNPEHVSHDARDLEPILCTLAYDSERQLYLVLPHSVSCASLCAADSLYEQLAAEHRDGGA